MRRYFNTEGRCRPQQHYMVGLDDRLDRIKRLFVDRGKYFVINRGRQYGKTTTLMALAEYLRKDYLVLAMDFQEIGTEEFADVKTFVRAFTRIITSLISKSDSNKKEKLLEFLPESIDGTENNSLRELFVRLSRMCAEADKPVVLMIDEVDSASNNQVFIDFLALLRKYYLSREESSAFHSVILAGVYDIKNLKLKLRTDEEHQYNSPWNIAAKFNIEMSFSVNQIVCMLEEYEEDCQTGMDITAVSRSIFEYTSGYPYLVSAICKFLDEEASNLPGGGSGIWTREGVAEAVKNLLKENIPLFDSMVKQLDVYKDLRSVIEQILYQGRQIPFSPAVKSINLGVMFGFLKEEDSHVAIANRIFEMYLLNLFISEESIKSEIFLYGQGSKNQFVKNGRLDMDQVLEKFVEHFTDIYGDNDEKFIETYGRKFFLLYLKPIINGIGNYYMEAQTRDAKRTDVIVDYRGEQFVIEMKIWHGNEYHTRGEEQLAEYLDYYHLKKGYMLSFNFNKKKEPGVRVIRSGDKKIVEALADQWIADHKQAITNIHIE